jgi:hypothetical protein
MRANAVLEPPEIPEFARSRGRVGHSASGRGAGAARAAGRTFRQPAPGRGAAAKYAKIEDEVRSP